MVPSEAIILMSFILAVSCNSNHLQSVSLIAVVIFKLVLDVIQPHLLHIINFIEVIATDVDHTESNVSSACGLVGDICSAFGAQVHVLLEKQAINELLQEGRRSKTHKTKQVATWATKELRKLKQQQN